MAITLPHDAMAQMFDALPANDLPEVPNYNVCPTVQVAVCTSEGGQRRYRPMRWGLVPHWYKTPTGGPLIINARSETIAEKPAFRTAVRERRCLIAATGFYEWKREKGQTPLPWLVTRADGEPMVFGGVWQDWSRGEEALTGFAVVTTDANADMAPVHDRLPLIVERADWPLWLGEEGHGAARLMRPTETGLLHMVRVDTAVNSNRSTGPELMAPIEV